jgi:hypothetical protein
MLCFSFYIFSSTKSENRRAEGTGVVMLAPVGEGGGGEEVAG